MSTFNLEMQYPAKIDWYETNTDGTPKCPAYWSIFNEQSEFSRYVNQDYVIINSREGVQIPFRANNIEELPTAQVKISIQYNHVGTDTHPVNIWFNNVDFITINLVAIGGYNTFTIDLPSNTEYILIIAGLIDSEDSIEIKTDTEFEFKTDNFKINTEQNDTSVNLNNKSTRMIDNSIYTTSLKEREIKYGGSTILLPEKELQLEQLVDLSSLNNFLTLFNVNINDGAAQNLAGIGYGGEENIVTYYFHKYIRTQKTGLYSYIDLTYELNPNASEVYL